MADAAPAPDDLAPSVLTCDGDAVPLAEARALSRRLHLAGFALLPLAWAVNAWLFRGATDAVVAANAAASRRAAAAAAVVVGAWAVAFSVGGPRVVGAALYDRLNLAGVDLASWGLNF